MCINSRFYTSFFKSSVTETMAHLLQVSSLYLLVIDISVRISHPLPPGASWEEKPTTLSESTGWHEGGSDSALTLTPMGGQAMV